MREKIKRLYMNEKGHESVRAAIEISRLVSPILMAVWPTLSRASH